MKHTYLKKLASLLAVIMFVFVFASCSNNHSSASDELVPELSIGGKVPASGAKIALVVTVDQTNNPFTKVLWGNISRFSGENGLTCGSYKTETGDIDAAMATLEMAITGGAELVIASGDVLAELVEKGQALYQNLNFILLDSTSEFKANTNTIKINYSSIQAGWLAGFAAVADGAKRLIYQDVDDILAQQFAAGFLMGADAAAVADGFLNEPIEVLPLSASSSKTTETAPSSAVSAQSEMNMQSEASPVSAKITSLETSSQSSHLTPELSVAEKGKSEQLALINSFSKGYYTLVFANNSANQMDIFNLAREANLNLIGVGPELSKAFDIAYSVVQKQTGDVFTNILKDWNSGLFIGGNERLCGISENAISLSFDLPGFEKFTKRKYEQALTTFTEDNLENPLEEIVEAINQNGRAMDVVPLQQLRFYNSVPNSSPSSSSFSR